MRTLRIEQADLNAFVDWLDKTWENLQRAQWHLQQKTRGGRTQVEGREISRLHLYDTTFKNLKREVQNKGKSATPIEGSYYFNLTPATASKLREMMDHNHYGVDIGSDEDNDSGRFDYIYQQIDTFK